MTIHKWEDMARHGSPEWECHYCGVKASKENRNQHCAKHAQSVEAAKLEQIEREKREHARIIYLLKTYGMP